MFRGLRQTNHYNDTYIISGVDDDHFDINTNFVSGTETETGTWTGPGSSSITQVTTTDMTGLSDGSEVTIAGTADYDGTYTISGVDAPNHHFDINHAFTSTQTGTWVGDKTKVTSINTLSGGETIQITGTTNYDGTYTVSNPSGSSFYIPKAFVADESAGLWYNTNTSNMVLVGAFYLMVPSMVRGLAMTLSPFQH